MKKIAILLLVLLSISSLLSAKNIAGINNLESSEASLIVGVESQNNGLVVSSANLIGDLKMQKAVIPLMSILKNSSDVSARISAAQALVKIGDARGVFAVKKAADFDKSERVRKLCAKFYFQSLIQS